MLASEPNSVAGYDSKQKPSQSKPASGIGGDRLGGEAMMVQAQASDADEKCKTPKVMDGALRRPLQQGRGCIARCGREGARPGTPAGVNRADPAARPTSEPHPRPRLNSLPGTTGEVGISSWSRPGEAGPEEASTTNKFHGLRAKRDGCDDLSRPGIASKNRTGMDMRGQRAQRAAGRVRNRGKLSNKKTS